LQPLQRFAIAGRSVIQQLARALSTATGPAFEFM
jgi:hypothetical protein